VARQPVDAASTQAAEAIDGSSRYDELFQSVYDAAIVSRLDGTIVDVNVRASEFLLYERAELAGLGISDIISGADESLISTLIENLEDQRFTLIQAHCVRKDGSLFPSEIAVNKLRLGTMHLSFFIRDVTLRKHAEEMLVTEHNAIQNAGTGIAIANLGLRIEYCNPAVATMWGLPGLNDALDKDACTLFADEGAAQTMLQTVIEGGESGVSEIKAKQRDGTKFDIQVSANCNRNSDGDVVGVVLSFVDISDRKRAEDAERESERRRVMLESLGAACHHLGQPATVLLANLGFLKGRVGAIDPSVKEVIDGSLAAMERLGKILHRLNAVNEYKTTEYLQGLSGDDADQSRILDI
jgi:PAS domain S-box-containing protein